MNSYDKHKHCVVYIKYTICSVTDDALHFIRIMLNYMQHIKETEEMQKKLFFMPFIFLICGSS